MNSRTSFAPARSGGNMTECPYCHRSFNPKTAERHIPNCKETKHRPKAPPSKEEIMKKQSDRRNSLLRNTQKIPKLKIDINLDTVEEQQSIKIASATSHRKFDPNESDDGIEMAAQTQLFKGSFQTK
jgi:hypothetical protein